MLLKCPARVLAQLEKQLTICVDWSPSHADRHHEEGLHVRPHPRSAGAVRGVHARRPDAQAAAGLPLRRPAHPAPVPGGHRHAGADPGAGDRGARTAAAARRALGGRPRPLAAGPLGAAPLRARPRAGLAGHRGGQVARHQAPATLPRLVPARLGQARLLAGPGDAVPVRQRGSLDAGRHVQVLPVRPLGAGLLPLHLRRGVLHRAAAVAGVPVVAGRLPTPAAGPLPAGLRMRSVAHLRPQAPPGRRGHGGTARAARRTGHHPVVRLEQPTSNRIQSPMRERELHQRHVQRLFNYPVVRHSKRASVRASPEWLPSI
ncbi:hypothetical protein V5799_010210 [Amblyomma americanum]|uniref:Uncharacterized protein n=1 Tax=Amblyomma americanum TaxID=6943 RepID=A0AAQ4F8C2_AMBAM